MKTLFTILFVSLALMPAKIKVNYDYDKTADFGQFKTFAVATPSAAEMKAANEKYPTIVNQINENYLTQALITQMEAKGYTQSETPDLKVTYNIKIQTQTQYNATTTGMGPGLWGGGFYGGYYGYGGFGGMANTTVTPEDYNTGSLVIDIVSTKTNALVWYGGGSSILSENTKKSEENINKNIAQIFTKYFWSAGQSQPTTPIPGSK